MVHHEYAPQGQTILSRLRDAVRRKRPELWSTGNWRLHHDNAPVHSWHLIQTPVVRQAPYSPDMAPCDFWLSRYAYVCVVSPPPRSDTFLTMKIRREHWTLPHINAACHQLTLLTGGEKKIHVSVWRMKVTSYKHASLKSTRFSQKMAKIFSNRPPIFNRMS